jgi:Na+/melibiose symporter-like transporter
MDYKEWTEKEKKKVIEERKKLESIKAEKINMESKAKKQKSSTGEKIAKIIMIITIVILLTGAGLMIGYSGNSESTPLFAKIIIYAAGIILAIGFIFYVALNMFSEYSDYEEMDDDVYLIEEAEKHK